MSVWWCPIPPVRLNTHTTTTRGQGCYLVGTDGQTWQGPGPALSCAWGPCRLIQFVGIEGCWGGGGCGYTIYIYVYAGYRLISWLYFTILNYLIYCSIIDQRSFAKEKILLKLNFCGSPHVLMSNRRKHGQSRLGGSSD